MTARQVSKNPFTPRFGKIPPHMAGRRGIIEAMVDALDGELNSPDLTSVFVGARGTGKTALLSFLSREAERRGWIAVDVSASPGMLEDIYERCVDAAAHLLEPARKRRMSQFQVGGVVGAGWDNLAKDENWRTRMNALFGQLEKAGAGILITVDEVDPELDEMVQLATTYQHFVREDKRVALLMAGLPSNVSDLISGKSTSFLRRASQHDLGSIPGYEVEEAFRLTVLDGGKDIGEEALRYAREAIGGFPFMFQLVGFRSWNSSADNPVISPNDVKRGSSLALEELRSKIFEPTYRELSAGDRAFLRAMLEDGAATEQKLLPERLGKSSSYVSGYKKRLLRQGVIEERPKGVLRFCVPGFRDYLAEVAE